MTPSPLSESDPQPLSGRLTFEEGDFRALASALAADPQYNDRRLLTRRKLLALGKSALRELGTQGLRLDCRTSLHHPHVFNGMRVQRLWAYLCRGKAEKKRLRTILGAELAKDLDAAYRNAYLCLAIEEEALEVSLRIHREAWYDGQNLVKRVAREGVRAWLGLLNELGTPWRLRLDDWKGEWRCGELSLEALEEFLSYYVPGEHALAVERRWPATEAARAALLEPHVPDALRDECLRLAPLYRFTSWSKDSDFLFG